MRGTYGVRISKDFMQAAKALAEEMGEEEAYRTFAQIEAQDLLYAASDRLRLAQMSWDQIYGAFSKWIGPSGRHPSGRHPARDELNHKIETTWRTEEATPRVMAEMREALYEMREAEDRLQELAGQAQGKEEGTHELPAD